MFRCFLKIKFIYVWLIRYASTYARTCTYTHVHAHTNKDSVVRRCFSGSAGLVHGQEWSRRSGRKVGHSSGQPVPTVSSPGVSYGPVRPFPVEWTQPPTQGTSGMSLGAQLISGTSFRDNLKKVLLLLGVLSQV